MRLTPRGCAVIVTQLHDRTRTGLVDAVDDAGRVAVPDVRLAPHLGDGHGRTASAVRATVSVHTALDAAASVRADDVRAVLRDEVELLRHARSHHAHGKLEVIRLVVMLVDELVSLVVEVGPEQRVHRIAATVLLLKPTRDVPVVVRINNV